MNPEKIRVLFFRILARLPSVNRNIIFKALTKMRFHLFKNNFNYDFQKKINNPSKVYWISPKRITRCLSLEDWEGYFNSEEIRRTTVDCKWDQSNLAIINNLNVYEAYRKRIKEGIEWQDTAYYKRTLKQVKQGKHLFNINNKTDLDEHCKHLEALYQNIKNQGCRLNRDIYNKNDNFGEIDVNIGRNGEFILGDGLHRFAIANILEIDHVPVKVFVRHKQWQDFRNFLLSYVSYLGGQLYQPPIHPDLEDIPHYMVQQKFWKAIEPQLLKRNSGIMLDIGANIGFFCHMFEDLGYRCYAIEQDPQLCEIMEKIKIAENKNFQIINNSIFDFKLIANTSFDVVLALNIFHHFLKTEKSYFQLINLLEIMDTNELYFSCARFDEEQMKNAYMRYTDNEFVNFIMEHTPLSKSKLLYTSKSGRCLFKLYK